MRSKEEAADYRYFEEPDLPLVQTNQEWISRIAAQLPELPHDKFSRFVSQLGLTPYEAEILVEDRALANYFEQAYKETQSKQLVNWILRDVLGYLKEYKQSIIEFKVTPKKLAIIIQMLEQEEINNHAAKEVFEIIAQTGQNPIDIVKEKGLEQMGASPELEAMIKEIIVNSPQQVAQLKAGKERMVGYFVGQAMKKTQGKGNPKIIQELLKKLL